MRKNVRYRVKFIDRSGGVSQALYREESARIAKARAKAEAAQKGVKVLNCVREQRDTIHLIMTGQLKPYGDYQPLPRSGN